MAGAGARGPRERLLALRLHWSGEFRMVRPVVTIQRALSVEMK